MGGVLVIFQGGVCEVGGDGQGTCQEELGVQVENKGEEEGIVC